MSRGLSFTVGLLCGLSILATLVRADPSTSGILKADDAEAVKSKLGQTVTVEGEVAKAEWSRTGKVMEIRFVGVEGENGFTVVVFDRNRKAMEEAFGGDLSAALGGATIRVTGKLREYGGRAKALAGRPELTLDRPGQLTILKAAPTTRPAESRPEPPPADDD
jgi:DNA/RNA endonuclease YhcR with UshA esterase domain